MHIKNQGESSMKFLSVRELRASTGALKEMLSADGKLVLTVNGKPTALMIEITEDSFEDILTDLRLAGIRRSIRKIQCQSVQSGLDGMGLDEINDEIGAARREGA